MDASDVVSSDETVREIVRKHWISTLPLSLAFAVLGLVALGGFYLLGLHGGDLANSGSQYMAALGLTALLVFSCLLEYTSLWVYGQNRLILTDKNLYQVTQSSLFSKRVSQFSLERLQDVSAAQNGFFASLFGYGDVTVETAGEEENFVSRQVPRPQALAGRIMQCHKDSIAGLKEL